MHTICDLSRLKMRCCLRNWTKWRGKKHWKSLRILYLAVVMMDHSTHFFSHSLIFRLAFVVVVVVVSKKKHGHAALLMQFKWSLPEEFVAVLLFSFLSSFFTNSFLFLLRHYFFVFIKIIFVIVANMKKKHTFCR